MRDLNDLYYFVQVVKHGGFTSAAQAMDLPKSKLSRRVSSLEAALGVRLIHRSNRQFSVTNIGKAYFARCEAMLLEAESAQDVIDKACDEPQGTVRLSCPPALLEHELGEILSNFAALYPRIRLQIESTNRRVDVIREGLDLAIRIRFPPLEDSDLVLKSFGPSAQCLVASPGLIQDKGGLPQLADISNWPSVGESSVWELFSAQGDRVEIKHSPALASEDRSVLRFAALRGVGIAQLPTMMIREDLAAGRLVDVLPQWHPRTANVHAVFPSRRGLVPSVRLLLDHLEQESRFA